MLKKSLFFISSLSLTSAICFAAKAIADDEHVSKIPPSASGVSIPNAHWIEKGILLRSNSPLNLSHLEELKKNNISSVLVFKAFSKPEAKAELLDLYKRGGFDTTKIEVIDFPWKDIANYEKACEQVISALRVVKERRSSGLLIHCTVGEDRTGLLSALIRQITQGWSKDRSFKDELCAYGFANANKNKDDFVKYKIHQALSPLFEFLSEAIQNKSLEWQTLNSKVCASLDSKIAPYRERYRWCPSL